MKFEEFMRGINAIVKKSGEEIKVKFDHDDTGKYVGITSNGYKFFGNSRSLKITMRWGSGHQAQFAI